MSQWGANDASTNAVLWAPTALHLAPNTTNRTNLYQNTTASAFITGRTDGQWAVGVNEIAVGDYYLLTVGANNGGTGGSYVPGDVLTLNTSGATVTSNATALVSTTGVRTVTATAASGNGYANGDTVTCNTGLMSTNAVFTVTTGTSNSSIASLTLTTAGVFTSNPTLNVSPLKTLTGTGSGGTANLTMKVVSLAVGNPGTYTVLPTSSTVNTPTGGTGSGAVLDITFGRKRKGVSHTGWQLRTVGTGGRAGRVFVETLVAGGVSEANSTTYPNV